MTPLGKGEYGVALFTQFTYIDHTGHEIIAPFQAEYVGNFSDGRAAVKPGGVLGGCGKGGYINTRGEWSIKPQFDQVRDFSEGLAAVNRGGKCGAGGKWAYIDKDGQVVIPFEFDFAGQFKNARACVKKGEQWALIDDNGNELSIQKPGCSQHDQ